MNRVQSFVDHAAARRVLQAAVECFDRNGYGASSIRQIAQEAGLTRTDVYDYFGCKLALLSEIAVGTYRQGLAEVEAAVAQAGNDPAGRLDAAIWGQCEFTIRCRRALRVIDTELHRLAPADRATVHSARARLSEIIGEIVDDGVLFGAFAVDQPAITSRALAGMCASISSWCDDAIEAAPRETADTYCELATRMAGAQVAGVRSRHLVAVPELRSA